MADMDRLLSDIFANYSNLTPAFTDKYGNRTTFFNFKLVSILGIDDVNQIFTFIAYLQFVWEDARFKWNPSEYGNITSFLIQPNTVWQPAIFLVNSAERGIDDNNIPIHVKHSGLVVRGIYSVLKTTCAVYARLFPFDFQTCRVFFSGVPDSFVNFSVNTPEEVAFDDYLAVESEWKLLSLSGKTFLTPYGDDFNIAEVKIHLERKNMFYIVSTIVPMFLLSMLTSLTFLFPRGSGEMIAYLISIFVSYAVFLNFITESMPRTSESISNLEMYLISVLVHCASAIVFVLATMNRASSGPAGQDEAQNGKACCLTRGSNQVHPIKGALANRDKLKLSNWLIFGLFFLTSFLMLTIFFV